MGYPTKNLLNALFDIFLPVQNDRLIDTTLEKSVKTFSPQERQLFGLLTQQLILYKPTTDAWGVPIKQGLMLGVMAT